MELTCPYCHFSKKAWKEEIPSNARRAVCPRCHQRFEIPLSQEFTGITDQDRLYAHRDAPRQEWGGQGAERRGAPWEERGRVGLWQGIYQTCKGVLFSPATMFKTMTFSGGMREPLAFGLLMGSIGSMFGLFWPVMMLSGETSSFGGFIAGHLTGGLVFFFLIVVIPALVTLALFVYSGVLHLLLQIVRGGQNGFEATFRVVSYSQATQALSLIPFVGGWLGGIWQIVVQVIGLRQIHNTSYVRVIVAFLIPLGLILLLMIGVAVPLFIYITHR